MNSSFPTSNPAGSQSNPGTGPQSNPEDQQTPLNYQSVEQTEKGLCPSCGTTVGEKTVCPNCGTVIISAATAEATAQAAAQAAVAAPVQSGTPANAEPLKPLDQVLLERFEKDPPEASSKRLPPTMLVGLLIAIVGLAFLMWTVTKKEDIYAEGRPEAAHGEHHEGDGHDHGMSPADSAQMQAQLAILNQRIDSLEHYVADNPNDDSARVNLAVAFSIKGDYPRAKDVYEAYLTKHPNDANARVDYASVVIETTNDPRAGMAELERAIAVDPKNPKALFNAAILSLQLREDHNSGFTKSREYLRRAKEASLKNNPTFASQIDMLIAEMDKKEKDIKAAKDSIAKAQ